MQDTRILGKHMVDGCMGFLQIHGHHHTFTGSQAIGFHHNGRTLDIDISMGLGGIFKHLVFSRRNTVPEHEGFGKGLGTFELRGRLRGAKNTQSVLAKFIHNAACQWGLGADYRQINVVSLRPFAQCHFVGER